MQPSLYKTPGLFETALKALSERDETLAKSYAYLGRPPLWRRPQSFATLVHIILEQQVSLASAQAAFERLERRISIRPENFLALDSTELKAIGFSRQKMGYARGLAEALLKGELELDKLVHLPDEAVYKDLMAFKGIGRWSAAIYAMSALGRPDVWPRGDLALAVAMQRLKGLRERPDQDGLERLAQSWQPYRAVAARLLWNAYLHPEALETS